MLQDIDLRYERSRGGIYTPRSLAVGGNLAVDGTATVGGTPVTPASSLLPADHGLIAWNDKPCNASTSTIAVNGTLYLMALPIRYATTISTVWWIQSTGPTTPTAGQNWAGLVSPTGTVLSSGSADAATTAGGKSVPLATPQTVTPGTYRVALLFNAATPPTLVRFAGLSVSGNSLNLTGAGLLWAANGTGLTALPGSVTLSANTTTGAIAAFAGVS